MSSGWLIWAGIAFSFIVLVELARLNFLLFSSYKKELKLPENSPLNTVAHRQSMTVIVPAKDEETHIGFTARSILASDYANLHLILVNDRSTDRTLEIMEDVAREDPRVRVMSVNELPQGWTGKTNAMFKAAERTTSDVLLFMDADAEIEKDLISRAVAFLVDRDLDMLSLVPGFSNRGFLENAVHLHLALGLLFILSLDRCQRHY